MSDPKINCLVFQYLSKVTPKVAEEFMNISDCSTNSVFASLEDLVNNYKDVHYNEMAGEKCKRSDDSQSRRKGIQEQDVEIAQEKDSKDIEFIAELEKYFPCFLENVNDSESEKEVNTSLNEDEVFLAELEKYYPCFLPTEGDYDFDNKRIDESPSGKEINTVTTPNKGRQIVDIRPNKKLQNQQNELNGNAINEDVLQNFCKINGKYSSTRKSNIQRKEDKINHNLKNEDLAGFCHILDCDMYRNLMPQVTGETALDILSSFILNKNILVRKVHQIEKTTSPQLTLCLSKTTLKLNVVKIGHFNPDENALIKNNWNCLLKECDINDPNLVEDILKSTSSKMSKLDYLKCNVLGLYLSLGMIKVRYTSDVFEQAKTILFDHSREKHKRLSPAEKQFVLDYVKEHGENCNWAELSYLLYKKHVKGRPYVKELYFSLKNKGKLGSFTFEEDKIILDALFAEGRSVCDSQFSESGNFFKLLERQLGRNEKLIFRHWLRILKPWLLQYHAGTLNLDIKRLFFNYLSDKKVVYLQDIEWPQLLSEPQFAGHTRDSLTQEFNTTRNSTASAQRLRASEVTVPVLVQYVNEKYKPRNKNNNLLLSGKKTERKSKTITYYKTLIGGIYSSANPLLTTRNDVAQNPL